VDIAAWLRELGLERYEQAFQEHEIDPRVLPRLTSGDLKELGVTHLGHRRLLLDAIAALKAASEASATGHTATARPPTRQPEAERRQLTVMFCDLVSSTALARRLDPEDMRGVIAAYQKRCSEVIRRYEGHVAKYMGDGVLAYFGYPRAHEDDAERAVRAGLELTEAVGRQTADGAKLAVRIGIATGQVVVGDLIGEGAAQEEAVVGETPSRAARLQALAEPGSVVIDPGCQQLVGGLFEYADLGTQDLKGFADPVQAWRVLGESRAESRFEALHGQHLTVLIGREHEIGLLVDRWERAKEAEGQVVLLSGEPGIGKSRIVRALRERLADEPHTPLSHYCWPHHTNSALYPVISLLERAAGFSRDDQADTRLAKLEALLARGTEGLDEAVTLIATEAAHPRGAGRPGRGPGGPAAGARGVRGRPLDRPHDPGGARSADRAGAAPAGPGADHLPARVQPALDRPCPRHAALALAPDPPPRAGAGRGRDRRQGATRRSARPDPCQDRRRAPLRRGADQGCRGVRLAHRRGRSLRAHRPACAAGHPGNPAGLTYGAPRAARPVKEIAQTGAVIGREFSHELLAAVSPLPMDQLSYALDQLVTSELVFRRGTPPEATYSFKHALVQDAAYESLLRSRRQQLHARIAHLLEQQFPNTAPEVLAHHLSEAQQYEQAAPKWLAAGQAATARSAYAEAAANLRRGLDVVERIADPSQRVREEIRLQNALGFALSARGPVPDAAKAYERARSLCSEVDMPGELFTARFGLWFFSHMRLDLEGTAKFSNELLAMVEEERDNALVLEAHHAGWSTGWPRGELEMSLAHAGAGIGLYVPETHHALANVYGGHDPGVCARYTHGVVSWLLGFPDKAAQRVEEALALARELKHPFTRAVALNFASQVRQFRRETKPVRELGRQTFVLCTEQGFGFHGPQGLVLEGWALAAQGHRGEGVEQMRQGLTSLRAVGADARRSYYLGLLTEVCLWAGQHDAGLEAVSEAMDLVETHGERWWQAELHRLQGELLLARNGNGQAQACLCFKHALDISRQQKAKSLELRAATSLARLWAGQGERQKAQDLLAPVYGWFTEGFDTADLKDAKALLDEIA
jgi:class 3 adenylate cyclase/predicted ATPase